MAKNVIKSVKGTRDFYPELMAVRTWLYQTAREVAELFGYQEWEAPLLETLDLYAAKSGEELVKQQSYVFKDRGGDEITLRPELTPSLARLIAQKQQELTFPLRWWSFGPFWRYERPQKGRTREFFQWNVDILGPNTPETDAENVAVLATFFQRVGLTPNEVMILVNDRRLINAQFDKFNVQQEMRPAVSSWIDRREKLSPDAWDAYGKEIGLSNSQLENLKAMLDAASYAQPITWPADPKYPHQLRIRMEDVFKLGRPVAAALQKVKQDWQQNRVTGEYPRMPWMTILWLGEYVPHM